MFCLSLIYLCDIWTKNECLNCIICFTNIHIYNFNVIKCNKIVCKNLVLLLQLIVDVVVIEVICIKKIKAIERSIEQNTKTE